VGIQQTETVSVDRSDIRVKAMLIVLHPEGARHLVSVNAPTVENPQGFHRLVGGSVELGERLDEAIVRELDEELGARIHDMRHLGMMETSFGFKGELGLEVGALYTGRRVALRADRGATLTESDGSVVPIAWRAIDGAGESMPLYPAGIQGWIDGAVGSRRNNR
jgi:8-oxo-dGTP pyrophosphatase MutT (NUDIX family)